MQLNVRRFTKVVKHCEAPADAMRLYGHVWSVQVSMQSMLMFDGQAVQHA